MRLRLKRVLQAIVLACPALAAPPAQALDRPLTAILLDHLCANTLRANEEDRLFGIISITVRSTIKYEGGVYSPDLIDDAVQASIAAMVAACPALTAADDAHRLGAIVDAIRNETVKLSQQTKAPYSQKQVETATAADLSEELTTREIDAWLDALAPPQRALAVFLYASDLTPGDIAQAVGSSPAAAQAGMADTKTSLLKFFREEGGIAANPPAAGPAMGYREVGPSLVELLGPGRTETVRVSGISSDVYSGWSLLATIDGLPPGKAVEVAEPFLLQPDAPTGKRMLVVGLDEISNPGDSTRRFLLKAFSIDGDHEGSGLRDTLHLGAASVANTAAFATLQNNDLSYIEKARCLASDFGTGPDPGLCR